MKLENATSIDKQSDIELYREFLNGGNKAFNALIIQYRKQLVFAIVFQFQQKNLKNFKFSVDFKIYRCYIINRPNKRR